MEWIIFMYLTLTVFHQSRSLPLTDYSLAEDELYELKGRSELVYPYLNSDFRYTESLGAENPMLLVVRTLNDSFLIQLETDNQILMPKINHDDVHKSSVTHFQGQLISHSGGSAAISIFNNENEMSGMILTKNDKFILRPLRGNVTTMSMNSANQGRDDNKFAAHVIHHLTDEHNINFCGLGKIDSDPEGVIENRERTKRSTEQNRKIIATAVYVDYPLYRKLMGHDEFTLQSVHDTVLAIVNEVQLIYNYQSLNTKFKIVVVKLEVLNENKEAPDPADGDIDQYLDNFCSWQSLKNPPKPSPEHWDHALMLSGFDLHRVINENERNEKVLGLAWVNGMCKPKHSCTLNEGSSFEAAFVIAHEIGHSLGMHHDGRGNDCDPSAFLMSEKTGPGRITWSQCSNDYLDKFFQKGYGSCLEDDDSFPLESLSQDEKLPGERFDLADQCKLSLGEEFQPHIVPKQPFNDVCRELWCVSGLWASVAHPALEGSSCGMGKRCYQGECKFASSKNSTVANTVIVEEMKTAFSDFISRLKSAFQKLVT